MSDHCMPRACAVLLAALAALAHPTAFPAVLITEIVTDPQQDHSETAGGNGIGFDAVPGTGTINDTDELVELFNAGSNPVDLSAFTLDFTDSTPATFAFAAPGSAVLRFSQAGDGVTNFSPGTFLVLGNPPGSLNNAITVTLRSNGIVEDEVVVANGNASGVADEAFARIWTGAGFTSQFAQTSLSINAPTPIPEPATALLFLAGLAALLAGRTRLR